MAHWVGAQGQVNLTKIPKTSSYYGATPRKPQTQNKKNVSKLVDLLNP